MPARNNTIHFPPAGGFKQFVVQRVEIMEDMNLETWTEDEVFDFMAKHFSEEVAKKFKGKPGYMFGVLQFTFKGRCKPTCLETFRARKAMLRVKL